MAITNLRLCAAILAAPLIALGLSSCSSVPGPEAAQTPPSKSKSAAQGIAQGIEQLSARTVRAGECSTFVWTADGQNRFVLFSQSSTQAGAWHDGISEIRLAMTGESGEEYWGQYTRQSFTSVSGQKIDLDLVAEESLSDGVRFKSGLLTHVQEDGWERVTPVVGLINCYNG